MRLMGGLGNQLFQYASARALALRLGAPLYLDERWYKRAANRVPQLEDFAIVAHPAPRHLLQVTPSPYDGLAKRLHRAAGRTLSPSRWPQVVEESKGHQLSQVGGHRAGMYLVGYWQNPTLFEPYWSRIGPELRPLRALTEEAARLRALLLESPSVSVHVRRGDFATDPTVARVHPLQEPDYYKAAMSSIKEDMPEARFFIFSDDRSWAKQHLENKHATVVTSPVASAFEDLMLMSSCRAHVISNSTFSWWGAWLGNGRHGRVVAPAEWHRGGAPSPGHDPSLPHWVRL